MTAPVVRPARLKPAQAPRQASVQYRERKREERSTPSAILLRGMVCVGGVLGVGRV